jgi:hypothetical protein
MGSYSPIAVHGCHLCAQQVGSAQRHRGVHRRLMSRTLAHPDVSRHVSRIHNRGHPVDRRQRGCGFAAPSTVDTAAGQDHPGWTAGSRRLGRPATQPQSWPTPPRRAPPREVSDPPRGSGQPRGTPGTAPTRAGCRRRPGPTSPPAASGTAPSRLLPGVVDWARLGLDRMTAHAFWNVVDWFGAHPPTRRRVVQPHLPPAIDDPGLAGCACPQHLRLQRRRSCREDLRCQLRPVQGVPTPGRHQAPP